ncbi:MAG: uncharacterized protein QOE70_6759 [Chthoniobacter sp.]|jgi:hypothetical protein|nr:uncharacterized protein [Chthoniobacter sp.]
MKKSERIAALVEQLGTEPGRALDPRYQGYFTCFNSRQYYEAHDVLEDLWLETTDENHRFFKGLIQAAGAFVHLRKHFEQPVHPKHGRRLRPAVRLFHLAIANLEPYAPRHLRLDVTALCELCRRTAAEIVAADFQRNPWDPAHAPRVEIEVED